MVEKGLAVCQSHGFVLRDTAGGVEVSRVLPHGPIDLQKEDVLISVDGKDVAKAEVAMLCLEAGIGVAQETVLEVSRGTGRVQEVVTVTMPCPAVRADGGGIPAFVEKPAFSFNRKKDLGQRGAEGAMFTQTEKIGTISSAQSAPEEPPAPGPELPEHEKEKALGNQAFKDSLWDDAIKHFTEAINLAPKPTPNTYYSNRAAAYLHADKKNEKDEERMSRLNKALIDAVKSTEGHPDFAKGHYRAGQALLELGRHLEAVAALNRARMCDPNNPQICGALSHAQAALAAAKKAKEEQTEEEKLKKEEEQNKKKKKQSCSGVMESAEAFAHAKTHDVNAAKSSSPGSSTSTSHQSASSHRAAERNQGGKHSQPAEGKTLERVCHPVDIVGSKGKGKAAKAGGLWGDDSGVFGAMGAGVLEAEKAKEDGNKAFAKGEFAVAAEHFTLAINLDPSNHVYHANRSAALLKMGKLEESLEDAHTAIKINPMYAKGHLRKGQALAVIGRVDLAVTSMEEAVKLDPSNDSLQEALAGTKRMRAGVRGEGEEVESWCSDVSLGQIECEVPRQGRAGDHVTLTVNVPEYGPIKIDAQIPEGYKPGMKFQVDVGSPMDIARTKKEEGIKAYRGGRMQKAVTDFSDSLHLNPRDAACFANRSASHYSLGKLEEALADAEQSISIEPSLHKGYLRKGLALAALCNFDAAVEALTKAHELCADDEAVLEALTEAKVDAAAQARGEQVSRDKREDDARKTSKYITHRTAAELEEKMDQQFKRTVQKQKEIAARSVERAPHMTNHMLAEEIRRGKAEDQHKADTEAAKFQAVRQGVDYDQFEQNVKGASLKATRTQAAGSSSGPGVLLRGGSGNAVPGLAKKVLNKEGGVGGGDMWLEALGTKSEDGVVCEEVKSVFAARAPAEEEALKLYLSNSKEFVRRWRALGSQKSCVGGGGGGADERYRLLRAVTPQLLAAIFKTEMEAEVMTEMTGVLAHALPRVCEIVGAAAGGHEEVDKTETREKKEEREAASHALELVHEIHRKVNLSGITKLSRFELNAKFLSKKEKQTVRAATDWCLAVEPDLQEQAGTLRKAFGCDSDR